MKRKTRLGVLLLVLSLPAAAESTAPVGRPAARAGTQALEAMESRLFVLTNRERQTHGLSPFRLAAELTDLARRHSADMARRRRLSHRSSNGESYEDRLVGEGLFFSAGGENVARGWPEAAEEIHASLMASPEHRANILSPAYDTIGIGAAIGDDGACFITQDFLKPIGVFTPEELKRKAVLKAQDIRASRAVPPLLWDNEAEALAEKLAQARAEGRELPVIPDSLGEVAAIFVVGPAFDDLETQADEIGRPDCREGGLGITFGRDKDHRGGAYFMVLLLLPENPYVEKSERERHEIVRAVFNEFRKKRGMGELVGKDELARDAEALSTASAPTRRQRLGGTAFDRKKVFISYETIDLGLAPAGTEASVFDPVLSGIGIKVAFEKTREFPRGTFRVTVVVQ